MKKTHDILLLFTIWLARIVTGSVFIVSGFVKAIDPWGTVFKTKEYLNVFQFDIWDNLIVSFVFFLCSLEFLTGIFLLLGCFRKSWPWIAAILMAFFLPLTLWTAISNPINDCGCFGDFFEISNWATFWKNMVLSGLILFLIIFNTRAPYLIARPLQWLVFVVSSLFIVTIEFIGYSYQPLLDFRGFQEGEYLISDDHYTPQRRFIFTYKKDNQTKYFDLDQLPEDMDGWEFVERKEIKQENIEIADKKRKSLKLWNSESEDDLNEEAIVDDGKELILFSPDLSKVSPAITWKINSLNDWAQKNDVKLIAVVAGDNNVIDKWKEDSMAEYPIYMAEDSQIKEIVRGNPGIVYLEDGRIKWKTMLSSIDIDDFLSPSITHDPSGFHYDRQALLRNLAVAYISFIVFFLLLSMVPGLATMINKHERNNITHDDKIPL